MLPVSTGVSWWAGWWAAWGVNFPFTAGWALSGQALPQRRCNCNLVARCCWQLLNLLFPSSPFFCSPLQEYFVDDLASQLLCMCADPCLCCDRPPAFPAGVLCGGPGGAAAVGGARQVRRGRHGPASDGGVIVTAGPWCALSFWAEQGLLLDRLEHCFDDMPATLPAALPAPAAAGLTLWLPLAWPSSWPSSQSSWAAPPTSGTPTCGKHGQASTGCASTGQSCTFAFVQPPSAAAGVPLPALHCAVRCFTILCLSAACRGKLVEALHSYMPPEASGARLA
jgi:hypothetical protein